MCVYNIDDTPICCRNSPVSPIDDDLLPAFRYRLYRFIDTDNLPVYNLLVYMYKCSFYLK